ncbi:MAG: cupin domain-containing protein [Dehalococcoidia bacterium]|nr:cupin domain-containing protein [Dehalococcoidia bacterium]
MEGKREYLQDHVLSADALMFDLNEEVTQLRNELASNRDRRGKPLVKQRNLNVVLTAMRKGTELREHDVAGPAFVQVLDGAVEVRLDNSTIGVSKGQMVVFDSRVRHHVRALEDSAILIGVTGEPGGS